MKFFFKIFVLMISTKFLFGGLNYHISAQEIDRHFVLKGEKNKKGENVFFLKNKGGKTKKTFDQYTEIYDCVSMTNKFVVMKKIGNTKLFGLINEKGKELIKCVYENLNNTFQVNDTSSYIKNGNLFILEKQNKKGALNDSGKEIIPFLYENIIIDYLKGDGFPDEIKNILIKNAQNKWDILDPITKQPKNLNFDEYLGYWHGIAHYSTQYMIFLKEGKITFFDTNTQQISPQITDNENHILTIPLKMHNMKVGLINRLGEVCIPFEYDSFEFLCYGNHNAFVVRKNGKYGLFEQDKTGKYLLTKPCEFARNVFECKKR